MFIKKGPGSSFVINIFLYNICVEWALLYVITNNVIPVTKYNFLANFGHLFRLFVAETARLLAGTFLDMLNKLY